MTRHEFESGIQKLFHQANKEEIAIEDIYQVLHCQALIAETLLKLTIEKAYKDRWY